MECKVNYVEDIETEYNLNIYRWRVIQMNQKQRVIKYIKDFGSITALDAMRDLGIQQLGARIDGLQKDGYVFKKEWEQSKNRYGDPVSFKRYSLEEMIEENMNHIPRLD